MGECWSDDQVESAARGESEHGAENGADHLDACPRCRALVDERRREVEILRELRIARQGKGSENGARDRVPGYHVEAEIRRGGQGIVYRAVQEATRRTVALKVLLAGAEATARERKRFEREIELASRLDHPSIVTLFDSGVAARAPWCAMEFVDGVPLGAWARADGRTLGEKLELARRIAAAVAHAHRRGVIHRDLKPDNVLVDAAGEPHLLDFGAAFAESDPGARLRTTAPGEFVGTLAYAAPEQLRGDNDALDTRTDVYALGVLLYELTTGELPFDPRGGVADLVSRATTERPKPPSSRDKKVDRDLDWIVLKALATDPADRYGSAQELERDLSRHLAGEPVEARGPSALYVLRKRLVKRRKAVALAALVLLLGGAAAFLWASEHQSARRQKEQAALVQSVIRDLLASAAPQRMGGDARLLDVYEVLAQDLDRALQGAPDVQAEVELTIGETYRKLLRAGEAVPHLRKALERLREVDDRRGLEVARAENELALALAGANEREAIPIAEAALAARERELQPSDTRVAESRRTLAIALLGQFMDVDDDRARTLLDRALETQRAAFGDEHPEVAETKLLRARLGEDLPAASVEEMFSGSLAVLERASAKDPRVLSALCSYAVFLQREERFDEARGYLDRAGALAQELFGDALGADMLRRHARLEFARGNAKTAELLSRQAVARELERWAGKKPELSQYLHALARRVEQPGSPASEPPFVDAFAQLRELEGEGAFELAQWMNGVALVLRKLERGTAAEPLLREALRIHCRAMGADCPVRRHTIEILASELADEHRGGEAIPLLEESLSTFERLAEAETPAAARARDLLETCRAQLDRTDGH